MSHLGEARPDPFLCIEQAHRLAGSGGHLLNDGGGTSGFIELTEEVERLRPVDDSPRDHSGRETGVGDPGLSGLDDSRELNVRQGRCGVLEMIERHGPRARDPVLSRDGQRALLVVGRVERRFRCESHRNAVMFKGLAPGTESGDGAIHARNQHASGLLPDNVQQLLGVDSGLVVIAGQQVFALRPAGGERRHSEPRITEIRGFACCHAQTLATKGPGRYQGLPRAPIEHEGVDGPERAVSAGSHATVVSIGSSIRGSRSVMWEVPPCCIAQAGRAGMLS